MAARESDCRQLCRCHAIILPSGETNMANTPTNTRTLRMDEDEAFETGEAITLEDGPHRGTVVSAHCEKSQEGYEYFQLVIRPDAEPEITLRYGCPLPARKDENNPNSPRKAITPNSKLGKRLMAFGHQVPGPALSLGDMRKLIEGKTVAFMVINEKARKGEGTFANVVENSIKPTRNQPAHVAPAADPDER